MFIRYKNTTAILLILQLLSACVLCIIVLMHFGGFLCSSKSKIVFFFSGIKTI